MATVHDDTLSIFIPISEIPDDFQMKWGPIADLGFANLEDAVSSGVGIRLSGPDKFLKDLTSVLANAVSEATTSSPG